MAAQQTLSITDISNQDKIYIGDKKLINPCSPGV